MADAGGIRAGRAYIELGVNDSVKKGLDAAKRRLEAFGASVANIGKQMTALGGVVTAPAVAGIKVYADFESNMAMVSTMLDDPASFMDGYSKSIRAMSVEFGEATGTMSKGLYDLLSASVNPAESIGVLRVAILAAKAGMTDTATSVSTLLDVMNAFHIPASRMVEVSDMLFMTVKRGRTTFPELAAHIGSVTATANAAGLSMDDLGASIATMTRNGLKTDLAVTSMNNILTAFLKPTANASREAKKWGVDLSVAGIQADGFANIMKKLAKADPSSLNKIFRNARGSRGVLAIRGDMEGFAKDVEMMKQKAGSTNDAFAKMAGLIWAYVKKIQMAGIEMLTIIGEVASADVKAIGEKILAIAKATIKWMENNKPLILTILRIGAVVTLAGTALMGLGFAVTAVAGIIGGLASLWTVIFAPLSMLFAVISGLVGILGALLSPISLITAGVIALVANVMTAGSNLSMFSKISEEFSRVLSGLADIARQSFEGIKNAIMAGDLSLAFSIAIAGIKVVWQGFILELVTMWDSFVTGFLSLLNNAGPEVRNVWITFAGGLIAAFISVKTWFSNFWEFLKTGWKEATAWLAKTQGKITEAEYLQGVKDREANLKINIAANKYNAQKELDANAEEMNQKMSMTKEEYAADVGAESMLRLMPYQVELDKAKDEFKALVAKAKEEASQIPEPTIMQPKQKLAAVAPVLDKVQNTVGPTAGSFYAAAFQALGSTSAADRTAKATESTANNTEKILDRIDDLELTFG